MASKIQDRANDIAQTIIRMKEFLWRRQRAYQAVFSPKDVKNVAAQMVLADLAKFCRANESTFQKDPRLHAVLEGRREVWLRICQHIKLDSQQLWLLYGKGTENG